MSDELGRQKPAVAPAEDRQIGLLPVRSNCSTSTYGATDAVGLRAEVNPVDTHDLNATILNQLGLNHVNLTFLHEGRSERPTVVYGHVVKDILA